MCGRGSATRTTATDTAFVLRPRLSVENTFSRSQRALSSTLVNRVTGIVDWMQGSITTRDLTGGVRYDVAQSANTDVHLFVRGGWGWTWYDVDNVRRNNGAAANYTKRGGYPPTLFPSRRWWPNSWYAGTGVEYFAPRNGWLLPQVGYGLRAELMTARHRVGATNPGERNLGVATRNEIGISAILGW